MKNLILKLTMILLLLSIAIGGAAEGNAQRLELQIKDLYITDQWADEISDTHEWLIVNAAATNWYTEDVLLSDKISAQLIVKDAYNFDVLPSFEADCIEPLVQLNGALVCKIPKMVSSMLDESRLIVTVDGITLMDETPILSKGGSGFNGKFEGDGFNSPEEAALAYLEAFNAGSIEEIASTFAIETYVDHVDRQAVIERISCYSPTVTNTVPMPTAYIRDLLAAERYGEIANLLIRQYLTYAWPEAYDEYSFDQPVFFNRDEPEEIEAFLNAFGEAEFNEWAGNIEFIGFENAESLGVYDLYTSEHNQANILRQANCIGCEEIRDVVLRIRVNGEDYLQFLSCARYDNLWYVESLQGNLSILFGLSTSCAGLVPADFES